ncbi:Protein ASI1 [Phlyctema vagabunda]|uniref:Protein ASI1 n=1 Tax=Phlyctema vagabunda TaxID=108571 RepID=A0ABR4PVQ2_9HELO
MAATTFNNGEGAFQINSWAGNWTNVTQYVPSARDLLWPARIFSEAVDSVLGLRMGQRIIPEATGTNIGIADAATTAAAAGAAGQAAQNLPSATEVLLDIETQSSGLTSRFSLEGARGLGSVFSYATSKWALACIVMAVILNRTHIYASTRRNLTLPWKVRFVLRIFPITLLFFQARWLLQSIQCQTSPDFGMLRWGNATKSSDLLFTQNGGLLHTLSSTLLFRASDADSCIAVQMVPPFDEDEDEEEGNAVLKRPTELTGSLSLLWPLFKTFSFSQFIETLSCAVQGRQMAAETGMTLFEQSLAFAEAENAIGAQISWTSFGDAKASTTTSDTGSEPIKIAITRSMIMRRVNTTPEVLLVGFLSCMNHITSQILGILNMQGRLRLINTGFWGLAFISFISWSIATFSIDDPHNQSILRFPTVCVIGFVPHVLVLIGIVGCSVIYGIALVLSAAAPRNNVEGAIEGNDADNNDRSFFQRLMAAHHNMQANVPLSSIRITMHMDFYTAILKTGFSVMTMASEAVYLNESDGLNSRERTWLEEERLQEIEAAGVHWLGPSFRAQDADVHFRDGIAHSVGLVAAKDQSMDLLRKSYSGYAREMTAQKTTKAKTHERGLRDGVGATERSGRWIMVLEFFLGIGRLVMSGLASLLLRLLAAIGLQTRPRFLLWLVSRQKANTSKESRRNSTDPNSLPLWLLSLDGELNPPKDENLDMEAVMRDLLMKEKDHSIESLERKLDTDTYDWFLAGGWWGKDDGSGDFKPDDEALEDDDLTSVVSFSTTSELDWESDDNDGRRTPTQRSPQFSRESTPLNDTPLSSSDLAQLLNPKTPEQRAEAQALSAHLTSNTIMTRSRFREIQLREKAKILTSSRNLPANFAASSPSGKLTAEEESQILEYLITSRRASHSAGSSSQPTSWAKGASGMGEGGPQCVVCQSTPRSIIVWPCRCLCLCDDCRVTLAMNNFEKCVCCRRDVSSFSRIFVP